LPLPIENADLLSVSRDGQLAVLLLKRFGPNAWWRTGTLAVVPVLGAAAQPLAEDVIGADWAPDGKAMAIVREVAGVARLEFPLGHLLHERSTSAIFFPRVSPSSARVAFFEGDEITGYSVSVVDSSGHRTVLSQGWTDFYDIAWSVDGREVWFAGTKPCEGMQASLCAVDMQGRQRVLARGPGVLDIHDVASDGSVLAGQVSPDGGTRAWGPDGPAERSLSWGEYSWPADLSPDGRLVLLNVMSKCVAGSEASYGSYLGPVDGAAPVRVADNRLAGRLSPDLRSLLFSEPGRIRVLPIGAGTPHTLDLSSTIPTALGALGWMPDGERIVVAAVEGAGKMTLRVLAVRAGQQQSVSEAFVPERSVAAVTSFSPVSLDGRVAVKTADGRVLIVPLDGSAPYPVPNSDQNDRPVQWSEDSRSLFLFRSGEIPARVFRVEVATGRRTLWKEIRPPAVGTTGLMEVHLTRDGRSGVYSFANILVDLYIVRGIR
jgi:eukaryotic-like serine/threonine-protein kinase